MADLTAEDREGDGGKRNSISPFEAWFERDPLDNVVMRERPEDEERPISK